MPEQHHATRQSSNEKASASFLYPLLAEQRSVAQKIARKRMGNQTVVAMEGVLA